MSYKVLHTETIYSSGSIKLKGRIYLSNKDGKKRVFSGIEVSVGKRSLVISGHNLQIIEEMLPLLKEKVDALKGMDYSYEKEK